MVHPRERGEAVRLSIEELNGRGPSPRARGSRAVAPGQLAEPRSIPASAGKPRRRRARRSSRVVHPRERGEADQRRSQRYASRGPSPRARGSLPQPDQVPSFPRSIPASAGKPPPSARGGWWRRVHPRERGEAQVDRGLQHVPRGPSPRARGSRAQDGVDVGGVGSIPASAGKPIVMVMLAFSPGVHPRERGEAPRRLIWRSPRWGPSPRARGSRYSPCGPDGIQGSIPASAGKPPRTSRSMPGPRVHPRERGEAVVGTSRVVDFEGPSPRARGSRGRVPDGADETGSIPASAGKPGGAMPASSTSWVHPRERGEAATFGVGEQKS